MMHRENHRASILQLPVPPGLRAVSGDTHSLDLWPVPCPGQGAVSRQKVPAFTESRHVLSGKWVWLGTDVSATIFTPSHR